jgi:hypothetical protein
MHDFEETAALVETKDFAVSDLHRPITEDNGISNTISDTIDAIRRDLADPSNDLPDNGDVIADAIIGNTNGTSPEDTILDDDGGELAKEPEILRCLSDDLELDGLAGESNTAQIIFLAATSRLFPSPLSVAVKGASSGGKTYTVQSALRFLPPEGSLHESALSVRHLGRSSCALVCPLHP